MNRPLFSARRALGRCIVGVTLACAATAGWAERADRDQPMHIESDALRYESQQQRSIFTGNVVVNKGTIVMRGARLEVQQDDAGNQSATLFGAPDKRAFFRQKREGLNEYIEGEANKIEYDGKTDIVRLIGDAEARRLVGATVQGDIRGSLITYDNRTEVYTVDGGGAAKGSAASGRVRATLAPRQAESADKKKDKPQAVPLAPAGRLPAGGASR